MDDLNNGDVVEITPETANDGSTGSFSWDNWQDSVKTAQDSDDETEAPAEDEPEVPESDPEDNAEDEAEDESENAKADEEDENPEEKPAKQKRTANYRELQTAVGKLESDLETERKSKAETIAKYQHIEEALEAYGGVEQAAKFIDKVDRMINPSRYKEVADYVASLPHGDAITAEILNRSFSLDGETSATAIANRVTVLNKSLAKDFGLKNEFAPSEIEQLFNWVATYANSDKNELFERINDDLTLLDDGKPPEMRKMEQELAALKAQIEQQKQPKEETPVNAEQVVVEKFDKLESDTFQSVIDDILKTRGAELDGELKELLQYAVRFKVSTSPVAAAIIDYLMRGKEDHEDLGYYRTQYRNAMKGVLNPLVSKLTAVKSVSTQPNGKPKQPLHNNKSTIAPTGKASKEFDWSQYNPRSR